jgi:hypothetical protein
MTERSDRSRLSQPERRPERRVRSRAKVVRPGRLPVSEFTFDRAGAGSPFGDDIAFPMPLDRLDYEHPGQARST